VPGHGFLENVYKKAMQVELQRVGFARAVEALIKVMYKNAVVGDFRTDVLVNDIIIVELKTAKNYNAEDEPQLLNELKATDIKIGRLINFGRTQVEFKRMIF
jgi:GxxExxY protein